jgi:hypothetical protein
MRTLFLVVAALLNLSVRGGEVDYKQFNLDSPVEDILWCGNGNEVILVLTELGEVHRSRDRGANWKRMQGSLESKGLRHVDDMVTDVSSFVALFLLGRDRHELHPESCGRLFDCFHR